MPRVRSSHAMACSMAMVEHPKAEWFRAHATECIRLALVARDARIKRLYALEAERWSRLAQLKVDTTKPGSFLVAAE